MIVRVEHHEGFGDVSYWRVRDNGFSAIETAAEHIAEHVGRKRGGDGYGYPVSEKWEEEEGRVGYEISVHTEGNNYSATRSDLIGIIDIHPIYNEESENDYGESEESYVVRPITREDATDMLLRREVDRSPVYDKWESPEHIARYGEPYRLLSIGHLEHYPDTRKRGPVEEEEESTETA